MKLVSQETSLVIAGLWNPAILTPEWILIHCLEKAPDNNSNIQVAFPVGMPFEPPRFKLDDLSYIARPDSLILFPTSSAESHFVIVESVAEHAIGQLKHTPISGIGHNFEFSDDAPTGEMLQSFSVAQQDIVDIAPEGCNVASSAIITSLKRDQLIINIQRHFDGSTLRIKFNFHYTVNSSEQALEVLSRADDYQSFYKNCLEARDLVKQLYGEIDDADE